MRDAPMISMHRNPNQSSVHSDNSVQALLEAKCLGQAQPKNPDSCPASATSHKTIGQGIPDAKIRQQGLDLPSYPGLERWRLLAKIGQGAFSNVYRARDVGSNAGGEVAVKVMRKFEMNKQQLSNLQKEIQIMRQLDQRNTTRLVDAFESRQYCYIIMELCSGGELFAQIVKLTYLSEALSRHVITQVAEAVKYLHLELGVVHRDIKPENILFDTVPLKPSKVPKPELPGEEDKLDEGDFIPGTGSGGIGNVKLADYGLSRIIDVNLASTPCGTLGYAAPETMCNDKYSTGVDMWALGCVLYALLAGYPPFYDPDMRTMTKKVSTGNFEFHNPWWDNISRDAKDLIRNLLSVDPEKRLDIEEFLSHPWIRKESSQHREGVEMQTEQVDASGRSSTNAVQAGNHTLAPLAESRIEARTPDAMNVREIFDVAFSVHRQQAENRHHQPVPKKIEQRVQTLSRPTSFSGIPLNGIESRTNRHLIHEKPLLSDHLMHRNTQHSELPSGLDMGKSVLLKRRRIQQEHNM